MAVDIHAIALFKVGGIEPLYSGAITIHASASVIVDMKPEMSGALSGSLDLAIVNIGKSISARSTTSATCPFTEAVEANISASSRFVPDVAVMIRMRAI